MGSVADRLKSAGPSDAEVLQLFREAQKNLISIIEHSSSAPFSALRRVQVRAIETEIVRLTARVDKWTKKAIPKLVRAGADEALQAIAELDEPEFAFRFAGVSDKAVKFLTERAFMDFGSTMVALRRNASRALLNKRLLQEKIVESVIQGSSTARTTTELLEVLRKDGISTFQAANGANWKPEAYTNMLVRTQTMGAYNSGARLQMLAAGRRFAMIPTLRPDIDGPDICNQYEKQKFIDLKKDRLPPWHPHCRHIPIPVSFAQLKAERPDLYEVAVSAFRAAAS